MKLNNNYLNKTQIFIIGNLQSGGAQAALLTQANTLKRINPSLNIFFISAAPTLTPLRIPADSLIECIILPVLISSNPFSIIKYFFLLLIKLRKISSIYKDISLTYTTPLASIISSFCCFLLNLKNTNYRIGGLLVSPGFGYLKKFLGYIIELFALGLSKNLTFVSNQNMIFYLNIFPFISKKKSYILYSPCCVDELYFSDHNSLESNINLTSKIIELLDNKQVENTINQLRKSEFENMLITVCNDKPSKGSRDFYTLSKLFQNNKKMLFVHLGSRSIVVPTFINQNLLLVPHMDQNIPLWLESASLSILLSTYAEGLAQVIPQSIAMGTPVVCFENSGISDSVINDFNGVVMSNKTSLQEIYEILMNLLLHDNLIKFRRNTLLISPVISKRHSIVNFTNKLTKIYFG